MLKLRRRAALGTAGVVALSLPLVSLLVPVDPVGAATDRATVTCDPVTETQPAPEPELLSFESQVPERIIDTRDGTGGVDAALDAGCTLQVDMSGIGGDDVQAFALSVTVISGEQGFFTAFPCAGGQPGTSSVNARPGVPTPNLVVGVPDADGMLCLFSLNGGNVVMDVSGWWADGSNRFTPIEPTRAFDTRVDQPTKLPADAVAAIDIAGTVVPEDAVSISLNVAVVAPETNGFLVVYPCGFPVPLASNLNFVAGEKRAVSAIVDLGPKTDLAASGKLCVSGNTTTHFLVDVTGYDAPSAATSPDVVIQPVADTRVVDTRDPNQPGTRFAARTTQRFDLSGVIERPDDAIAVVLNAVAVQADTGSFASITPCTPGTPTTSSLNYDLAQTANLVVTALSPDVEFCVYADTAVHVVIDLVGVVTGPPGSLVNQLSFSETDGTVFPLDQPFVVDGADYTTRCDGDRDVGLRLGLAPRVTATINGIEVAERDPVVPDLPITLTDDGLTTIELERGSETATYHVRCLPADFPTLVIETAAGAAPGWYLTDMNSTTGADFLVILNERAVPVWYQRLDRDLIDAKLLSTGDIVAAPNPPGFTVDPTLGHRVVELDGTLVDVRVTSDDLLPADKHDYVEIPALTEGRAVISYPLLSGQDLTNLDLSNTASVPRFGCDPSVEGVNKTIVDGTILELSGDSTELWRWNASDHFSIEESTFPLCFQNYPDENDGAGAVDPFHINSLSRITDPGCEPECDYLISARHLDAVVRIDRSSGTVDWILSKDPTDPDFIPNDSGAPALNIVGDPLGGPLRMHDAILVGDRLTMHDNRTASGQSARFVEYQIDTTGPESTWTATYVRQIDSPFGNTSGSVGSARVADDGSVLMAWGAQRPVFGEYAADGTELLRIDVPGSNPYRIVKYPVDAFDPDELRETAGNSTEVPT